jgi:putative NIF3 family GTP cyclohydrolase 1 type 2
MTYLQGNSRAPRMPGLACRAAVSAALCLATASRSSAQPITAQQVIDRIKAHVGVPWTLPTVDTIKAGDASTPVTGIAVTMMATFDVLQRAARNGQNLVITHEPTFYDHLDSTAGLVRESDAVTAAKLKFIADHRMVVWRFHDFAHGMEPDIILTGVVRALGWSAWQDRAAPWRIRMPETSLAVLVDSIRHRLGAHAVRAVGDPALRVTTVALVPGAAGFPVHRLAMRDTGTQVLVIGEAREWETVEYLDDAIAAGQHRALIIIGHIPSEQPGMEDATRWIQSFVKEVPVVFVPAKDPFWIPR